MGQVATAEELLRTTPIFSRLTPADRRTVAEVSRVQQFGKGERLFEQESPSDAFYAIAVGTGEDLQDDAERQGPDPRGLRTGAIRSAPWPSTWHPPFPASAMALDDTTCVIIPRPAFFRPARVEPLARPWLFCSA